MANKWRFLDVGKLDPNHCYLSASERTKLYEDTAIIFEIDDDKNKVIGLNPPNIASTLIHQSNTDSIMTIIYYFFILSFYFIFTAYILASVYFIYYHLWKELIIYVIIFFILALYPIKENKEIVRRKIVYNQMQYFSFRQSVHNETYKYMLHTHSDLVFMSMPHGTLPLCSVLGGLIASDLYPKNEPIGCAASIIFYIPMIRNFAYWFSVASASKKSMKNILVNMKRCPAIICDGISGMFCQSKHHQTVLIKHRMGVSKLVLQCGSVGVVPEYGFGNTECFDFWFDSFGIMRYLSKKMKVSFFLFYGRWFLPIPKRIPFYSVVGPIVRNKYANKPIENPTNEQIQELHDRILRATKRMFDQHKGIYGWDDKELVFM